MKKEFLDKYPDVRIQEQASQSGDILFAHKVMALSDNVGFYESSVYFRKKVVVFSGQNVNNSEILRNIRIWLNRLDEFYTKYNLWGKKKLHLLSFINSELYGIYQNVQFSRSDRTCFFDLVHKFVEKHKLNERELVSKFSRDFYFFITSDYYTHNIKVKLNRWGIGIKIFFLALNECKNESIKCIKFLVKFQNLDNLDKKNAWKDLFTEYQKKRNLVLEKLRREKKRKIRVCFLVTDNDKWNAQPLYEAMEKSEDFYPFIVVTRMRNLTGKSSLRYNIEFFESCCKNVKVGFDEQTNCGIDIKSFKPDIVFYQQPWDVYENQSPVHVLDDALSYYFPYAIGCVCMTLQRHINEFYLVLQKHFVFSEEDRQKCVDVCEYLDSNTTIAGHPKLDVYANYEERNFQKKYVIYAPHHSFYEDSILCYATFDWSGKYVLEWAKSHPELNWVFKPHPLLKQALLYYGHMTADEIEKYYQDWDDLGIYYNDGNYFDLFKNSRCLITDCGSFLTEYFPTKNPVIHLRNPKGKDYSADNKKIMQTYYDVWNIQQLRSVLDEVLLNGKDIKRKERVSLLKKMEIGKYRSTDKIMSELKKDFGRIDDNLYKK